MEIYFGPYRNWIGPYQIADILQHVGVSEDRCHDIGRWLAHTWLDDFCNYIYSKRKRTIKVKIHNYDVWNLDHTLSLIIVPCLEKLKTNKMGVPTCLSVEDYPEELRCPQDKLDDYGQASIEYSSRQWEHVLDEMIWAFKSIQNEDDLDMSDDDCERQKKGLILFGKYFRCLWN